MEGGDEAIYFKPASDVQEEIRESRDAETPFSLETKNSRKNALLELRVRVGNAILGKSILGGEKNENQSEKTQENLRDLSLWGVPLLPSKGHAATDVILMKFLKARDFKAIEAFKMLQKTLKWRRRLQIDQIIDEDFGPDLENAGYICSRGKNGHPVCYVAHRISKWKNLCKKKSFVKVDKREMFLKWNIKFMEKCIQHIDFRPGGANSVIRIVDLNHAPANAMKELHFFFRRISILFRENYPGIIFRHVSALQVWIIYNSHFTVYESCLDISLNESIV